MITVRDIEQFLYDWAPPDTAESWDNVGLLVGRPARARCGSSPTTVGSSTRCASRCGRSTTV